jgi:hypothetical protein
MNTVVYLLAKQYLISTSHIPDIVYKAEANSLVERMT